MNLARMDDVSGCRLIFGSINELYSFREHFHKARYKHKRRNQKTRISMTTLNIQKNQAKRCA